MHAPRKRISRALIGLVLLGTILMATVASHGCDVRGSSPDSGDSAQVLEYGAPVQLA